VRCASTGAERPEGGLRADPAFVAIPQPRGKKVSPSQCLVYLNRSIALPLPPPEAHSPKDGRSSATVLRRSTLQHMAMIFVLC
jgi:hypothetical protein